MTASITFKQITPTPDPKSKATPLPRSSHGLSALKNGHRLVLYGGENVARTPITDAGQVLWLAEKKDGNDEWNWIAPTAVADGDGGVAPPSRVAHSQAAVGDSVYIFGGRNGITMGENPMNDLWKLEVVTSGSEDDDQERHAKWTEIILAAKSEVPSPRSFHKMIAVSNNLYVFGGCGPSGRLNDLWKFDTVNNQWTNFGASDVLKGRGGPNILSLSGENDDGDTDNTKLAIVAGFAGEETNDGHIFNNNSWEAQGMDGLADMRKRSVCCFGSLPRQKKCLIFGGEVEESNLGHEGAGGFERDVVLLDGTSGAMLENIKPKEGEVWPESRGWADATVGGDDTFYLFGGLTGDDASPTRLDDLWQCQVSS